MKKLVVIDGNSLANRAFYGVPVLSNSKGVITNAVYGFTNMLMNLLQQENPDYLAVAFDISKKVFRHDQYDQYKAQRKSMPDELRSQMALIKQVLEKMNIPIYQVEGYEGDDIIGTMVKWAEKKGVHNIIVTGDKDALQLVSPQTTVYLTKKGISEIARFDLELFREEYQMEPDQMRDLKGLMGDPSDNIPGIPGVGEKTALKYIHQYQTVEGLYDHLDDFKGKKIGEKIIANQHMAYLSKQLATIMCEVPIMLSLEDLSRKEFDYDGLVTLYKELELNNLLKALRSSGNGGGDESNYLKAEGTIIEHAMELIEIFNQERVGEIAIILKVETKCTIMHSKVLEIGLLINKKPYLILCNNDFSYYAQVLKPYLSDPEVLILSDDAKLITTYFLRENIKIESLYWDSTLGAYLLNPEKKDISLDKLLDEFLQLQLEQEEPQYSFGKLKAIDAVCRPLIDRLEQEGLLKLYAQIEVPLSAVLASMEIQGVKLDREYLTLLDVELTQRLEVLTATIYEEAGEVFNINSTKQLGVILFEKLALPAMKKTKTGYSTDAEVLENLAQEHEIVKNILSYRQLAKLKSTYIEGLLKIMDENTQKVHTSFNQTITATGRLSSTEPNLQNIPIKTEEGKRIRKAFIPSSPEHLLLCADYSQIELRILAHMSQDKVLLESFSLDQDIHARTAAEVFGVPMEEVTKQMRRNAKAVNFGIIYGQSDFGLSKELGITRKEAKEYIDGYFEKYEGVKKWIDQTILQVQESQSITTMFGRKRYIPDINSKNFNLRSFAQRTAINTPIQGTAADIIKIAMINIQRELTKRNLQAKMILQVHDELIFEAPPQEVAALILLIREYMEKAVKIDVPLKVDMNVGFNWYDMESV